MLAASFVLVLPEPLPVSATIISAIKNITGNHYTAVSALQQGIAVIVAWGVQTKVPPQFSQGEDKSSLIYAAFPYCYQRPTQCIVGVICSQSELLTSKKYK